MTETIKQITQCFTSGPEESFKKMTSLFVILVKLIMI